MSDDAANMPASQPPLPLILIAALTRTNGLGVNGTLAWRLPKEMAHFRKATSATTKKNAVIMGRKTWQSIPPKFRPLKDRINIVISRQTGAEAGKALEISSADDSYLVTSLDAAAELLRSAEHASRLDRTFLIGGAQLYAQAIKPAPLPHSQRKLWTLDTLIITRIHEPAFAECDVFLPEFRTPEQIRRDDGLKTTATASVGSEDGEPEPLAGQVWEQASSAAFDAFLGEPVEHSVVEEKGVRYSLQMWTRLGHAK